MHPENARFYHMYGLAMFEMSSQNTDVFGEVVKEAIKRSTLTVGVRRPRAHG